MGNQLPILSEIGEVSTAKRIAPFLKNEMRIFKEKRNVSRMQEPFYNSLHFQ